MDCGNLLKAADECNISQSGLSRSIGSLEERLGVQLLYRKSKGVEPTLYGEKVLQRARLILNEVARCTEDIRAIKACEVGEIAFGVTQNYGYYLIPELLADVNASLPGIRVTVKTGGFLDLVDQLKIGAIDFVFGLLGPIEESSEIVVQRLREHHSRVIARSSHPLALVGREVTPEELRRCTVGDARERRVSTQFWELLYIARPSVPRSGCANGLPGVDLSSRRHD